MHLHPQFDRESARAALDTKGRAAIPNLLAEDDLARLRAQADADLNWNWVTILGGRHLDLEARAMRAMPVAQRAEFDRRVQAEAAQGFAYLFENYPVYDKAHGGVLATEAPVLAELFAFLNGEAFLAEMRHVLDCPDIRFADAQLTSFQPGHFLSTHDDGVEGKNRVAAYVLSLTEGWQEDWGGQLEFYAEDGSVEDAFRPRLNTLSIFKVPKPHAVMPVLPAAQRARVSVTGWLRKGEDPGLGG